MKTSKLLSAGIAMSVLTVVGYIYYGYNAPEFDYRENPKVGDVYFVNYYELNNASGDYAYPYRMAKVANYDRQSNQLTLKLGAWAYKRTIDVTNAFFISRDRHSSYFWKKDYQFSDTILNDLKLVNSVRRRDVQIDVELAQLSSEFKKKYANPYPLHY